MMDILTKNIKFFAVKGVGQIQLDLTSSQRVYTFIGENGIGKTKLLESLFAVLLLASEHWQRQNNLYLNYNGLPFHHLVIDGQEFLNNHQEDYIHISNNPFVQIKHHLPVVYIAAQQRSTIQRLNHYDSIAGLGDKQQRLKDYLEQIRQAFQNDSDKLKNLNMTSNIESWLIQRAQSSNRFQADADNREIEIITLLRLLHEIDSRIDAEFLEISGNHRVFIKVANQKTELSELSSGFTSILKILQAIISGYSYYTNEQNIAHVRGVVIIDEIESHLHNQWQVKIIPLLKRLFVNTTFIVSTHSSLVISQLQQGEAYRLERNIEDGVVYSRPIESPNKASFIDVLKDAFDVDLNQVKLQAVQADEQHIAKQALLAFVQAELANLEK